MFDPIDHKDSDPEYRSDVRTSIEMQHGPLLSIGSKDKLVGRWRHSLHSDDGTPYILHSDGTISCKYDEDSKPKGRWDFDSDQFTDQSWCDPIPEYGIEEGTWNSETYHCMTTAEGVVLLWNGDGSLLMTLTKIE